MILFPYIFGRIGGGSITELEDLRHSQKLKEFISEVLGLDADLEQIRQEIVSLLYQMIQTEKNAKVQNSLLNLKRAVFNKKTIASLAFFYDAYLKEIKESKLNNLLIDYSQCYEKRNNALTRTTKLYKHELDVAIKKLDTLCHANYLSNGFLFASEKLSRSVGDDTFYKKQKEKTVFSLLKYLTRSVTKTTPFSTFNTVFCTEKNENGLTEMVTAKQSYINPNNLIFLFIKKWLIFLPESRSTFQLSINTSIFESGEHYIYFVNIDNNEFLKRIKKTPTCVLIKKAFEVNLVLNYADLVSLLQKNISGPAAEASTFIDKIITEGFILIQFPVSMYDPNWPARLVHFINKEISLENEFILSTISFFLVKLSLTKRNLESDKATLARKRYLTTVHSELLELKKLLLKKYPAFPFQNITENISSSDLFYEDFIGASPIKCESINLELFTKKLSRLRHLLPYFDERKTIRQSIKTFIINDFEAESIPLLTFLEVYFNGKERFESEANQKLLELVQSPDHLYFNIIQGIENCTHDLLDLERIPYSQYEKKEDTPYGLYAQITNETNNPILIINGESSGYGKNFSRFLAYIDPIVSFEIIERLKANHPDAIIADVHDASIHNSNMYPAFTDYYIDIPGNEPDPRAVKKIPLTDLFLTMEKDDVILTLKDGQKIIPFNFSMENINRKSALIKFFDLFSVSSHRSLLVMEIATNYFTMKLMQSENMIRALPRILYGENIVLGRRKWLVKKAVFYDLLTLQPFDKFSISKYLQIAKWRNAHVIPDEVFVKIKKRENNSFSSYKPQYINFEVPLLVACFISLLEDADEIIEITEMFPGSDHLNENTLGNKYVQEFVLNYN
jgi:hypothetical protein